MSILSWIEDQKRLKVLNAPKYVTEENNSQTPPSDSSKGLWTRCDKCGVILYIKHLKENQRVCFGCSYHLQMSSQERIENLIDKDTWRALDETVSPCDPLQFHDQKNYTDRLQDAQEKTGLQDAVQTGTGMIESIPVALAVMDFEFMGGSMGSVVGEKITRLIEYATQEGLTLLIVCASGGARMQEGVFSLMQMAKISSALQIYQSCANLLYISILTSPTTGGVTASFAMLGDIIFAEPKALIAFAGRRVIEQTLREDLPDDFQTSEYMLHHGLVDLIVPRRFLRQALSESIRLYQSAPFKKAGKIPFGVQNPISFVTEEKIRRKWGALTEQYPRNQLNAMSANSWYKSPNAKQSFGCTKNTCNAIKQGDFLHTQNGTGHAKDNFALKESYAKQETQSKDLSAELGMQTFACVRAPKVQQRCNKGAYNASQQVINSNGPEIDTNPNNAILVPSESPIPLSNQTKKLQSSSLTRINQSTKLEQLLHRSVKYREILTSFEVIFDLFSKTRYVDTLKNKKYNSELFTKDGFVRATKLCTTKQSFVQEALRIEQKFIGKTFYKHDIKRLYPNSIYIRLQKSTPQKSTANFIQNSPVPMPYKTEFCSSAGIPTFCTPMQTFECKALQANQKCKSLNAYKAPHTYKASLCTQSFASNFRGLAETKVKDTTQNSSAYNKMCVYTKEFACLRACTEGASVTLGKELINRSAVGKQSTDTCHTQHNLLQNKAFNSTANVSGQTQTNSKVTTPLDIDFLNQAIEIASTQSVEWRAFYMHQHIAKTAGFLEDFVQHDNKIRFCKNIGGKYSQSELYTRPDSTPLETNNLLFYRSICRSSILKN